MIRASLSSLAVFVSLGFASLMLASCGGGKDDDKGSELRWECYADTQGGTCECTGLGPLEELFVSGDGIVAVDACVAYDACFSYYDESFEEHRCDCGDSTFWPFGDNLRDVTAEDACPAE